jgi:hypothetical protein
MSFTDNFTTPDDLGPIRASDLHEGLGASLAAQGAEALDPQSGISAMQLWRRARSAMAGGEFLPGLNASDQPLPQDIAVADELRDEVPDTAIDDAKARVKQEGLEGLLPLPDQPSIKTPVLNLMIQEAHEHRDREAAIARGPQGFVPGALGLATSIGAGMIDPVNAAAFSIPVLGEARWGKLLYSAGDSLLARGGVRALQGAVQGAAGTAALQPAEWWMHTADGRDYTMAEALRSVIMGAGMGAAFHAGFGAFGPFKGDIRSKLAGEVLPGSPGEKEAFDIYDKVWAEMQAERRNGTAAQPETARPPEAPGGVISTEEVPGFTGPAAGEPPPAGRSQYASQETQITVNGVDRPDLMPAHPAQVLADLPPQAREDVARASIADLVAGRPVRAGEMLATAAQLDPRIAESVNGTVAAPPEAGPVVPVGQETAAVHADVLAKLEATGMDRQEALTHAALFAARYATRAQRLEGKAGNAFEIYQREGLNIAKGEEATRPRGRSFAQTENTQAGNQEVLPGAEKISDAELAQRRADQALKPGVAQKPADFGLFGDSNKQIDLLDLVNKPPAQPRMFDQSLHVAPPFFSGVARAIEGAKQDKASPEQWLGTLKNAAGVKPEEMKWLGLEDWLKEQKGAVSRQQLQDFIRANSIEVQEVEKTSRGMSTDIDDWQPMSTQERDEFGGTVTLLQLPQHRPGTGIEVHHDENGVAIGYVAENRGEQVGATFGNFADAVRELSHRVGGGSGTKFGSYTLPGGENYRELLLTLPETRDTAAMAAKQARYKALDDQFVAWAKREAPELTAAEMAERKALQGEISGAQAGADTFRGSHWEEPNVIAHVRFNDRTIDGKKTLFVEEVQSDWHQKGKRQGYTGEKPSEAEINSRVESLAREEIAQDFERQRGSAIDRDRIPADVLESFLSRNRERLRGIAENGPRPGAVPDAPFKTSWSELAMKRIIRYAADHDYDQVAWTPGDVQAARYDLSKRIDLVVYKDGKLTAIAKGGQHVIDGVPVKEAELADHIGKEAAEKLIDQAPHNGARSLRNADLEVGGEGMKGFYDQILPATVNKLVKKFGAKVEEAKIGEGDVHALGAARAAAWDKLKPLLEQEDNLGFGTPVEAARAMRADRTDFDERWEMSPETEAAARQWFAAVEAFNTGDKEPAHAVHALAITPELRKAALEQGFPLFQKSAAGEARGRITLGQNRALIQLFEKADKSTFLHESGHLWLDELTRDAARADAPQQLRDDMAAVLKWLGVKKASDVGTKQHEKWARGFERYLAEGKAPAGKLTNAFERFKIWLKAIYHSLSELGEPVSDDIRGVMDRMIASDDEIAAQRQREHAAASRPGAGVASIERPGDRGAADDAWRPFADAPLERDNPDAIAQSNEAAREPEPASVDPAKAPSAAEKAAAEAEQLLADMREHMTHDERAQIDDALQTLDREREERSDIIKQGAACLAAAAA